MVESIRVTENRLKIEKKKKKNVLQGGRKILHVCCLLWITSINPLDPPKK